MIAVGLLINTLAWNLFLIPHEVAGGGATGIAAIVMYATKGLLPVEVQAFFSMLGMETLDGGIPITVMARRNESTQIFKLIKDIDPDAFISQSAAIGVYGRGFDPIGKK